MLSLALKTTWEECSVHTGSYTILKIVHGYPKSGLPKLPDVEVRDVFVKRCVVILCILVDIIVMHVVGIYIILFRIFARGSSFCMGSLSSNATIENMFSFALFSCALVSFTYLIYADLYFLVLVLEAYPTGLVLLKLGLQANTITNNIASKHAMPIAHLLQCAMCTTTYL